MATEINAGRVAMVPKGEWSASTAYVRLDVVSYHGSSYVCKQDGTGQTPDTATNYWQLLSSGLDPTVDTISAKHYEGSTLTAETSISAAGVISKTASGVTKTYDLPAESGTLARKEETLPNKTYAPLEFSGLGRKYLQKNIVDVSGTDKNILTQAMLKDGQGNALTNYVFVVQYDYDLNGQTVNVPAGTTLKFEGGSIKNGTLNFGKGVLVESEDVKIFDDVLFTGDCGGQYFHIDWFVANYAQTIASTEPDATEEIQAMFDCGIKKVYLTNKHHYRITSTIVISPDIAIDGQGQKAGFANANKYIFGSMDTPLVTFKAASGVVHYNTTVNNMYLYRLQTDGSLTKENGYKVDIPTFYIDCTEGSIYGFFFNGVVTLNKIKAKMYAADETTFKEPYMGGYTAFEVYAANGYYFSGGHFDGYVNDYFRGINVHKDNYNDGTKFTWITSIFIGYTSSGAYGGYICCDCFIASEHQTRHLLPKNDDAFFTIDGYCHASTIIWDTGYTQDMDDTGIYSTEFSINASRVIGGDNLYDIRSKNQRHIKENLTFSLLGNANLFANLVPNGFYNNALTHDGGVLNAKFRVFESDADYESYVGGDTSKGTAVTPSNTFGYYDLFFPDKLYYDNNSSSTSSQNYARKSYVKDVSVKKILFTCNTSYLMRSTIVVFAYSTVIESIVVNNGVNEYTYNCSARFNPIYAPMAGGGSYPIKVVITYTTAQTNVDIPYIGICGPGVGNMIGPWGGNVAGALAMSGKSYKYLHHPLFLETKGDDGVPFINLVRIYSTTTLKVEIIDCYSKHLLYISSTGVHIHGGLMRNGCAFKVYTKSNFYIIRAARIYNATISSIEAVSPENFSRSVTASIVDTGEGEDISTYTLLPNTISATSSGETASRPTVSAGMIGTLYFDTTLGKMIVWNGSAWVNLDGTALS